MRAYITFAMGILVVFRMIEKSAANRACGALIEHALLHGGSILCIWSGLLGDTGGVFGSLPRVGTNWLCAIARIITHFLQRILLGARECSERPNRRPEYVLRIRSADKRYPILFGSISHSYCTAQQYHKMIFCYALTYRRA